MSDEKPAIDKPKHSPIGASSMSRWAACPGSVKLSQGQPNVTSVAALEGTAAHDLIGLALERAFSENVPTRLVVEDVVKAVLVYADYVESLNCTNRHVEHGFDMSSIFDRLYGTSDFTGYDEPERMLHVVDYKHGKGLPVEVEGNKQLQYYALGVLHTLPYRPTHVTMTIVQPRCYHPAGPIRSWTVPTIHFIDFRADLVEAAEKTLEKKAKLIAGDHCIFCRAKSICPETHKSNISGAKRDFKFYVNPNDDFQAVGENDLFD